MIRAYKYLFYKLCVFERVLFDPVPGVSAFCFMLALQCFNILSLFVIIHHWFAISLLFRWSFPYVLFGFALLALPQYFFLLYCGRFKRLVGEFARETERRSLIGGFVVGAYIVLSFLLLFLAAFIPPRNV